MKQFFSRLGILLFALSSLIVISTAIALFGSDSYSAGKMSIQMESDSKNELNSKIERLQLDLANKKEENIILKQYVEDYQSTIAEKEAQNLSLTSQVDLLTVQRDEVIASNEISQEEINNLNSQIDTLNQTISDNEEYIDGITENLEVLNNTIESNENEILALNNKVNKLFSMLNKTVVRIESSDLEGLTKITNDMFSNCDELTYVEIPDCITNIGASAFSNCNKLETVIIPSSVSRIGYMAFDSCIALQNISFAENANITFEISCFSSCKSLSTFIIPDGTTSIPINLFIYCSGLTEIYIPDSVISIGSAAFLGTSIKSLIIPDSVTSIGSSAFSNNSSLENVSFPNIVQSLNIESNTFEKCTNLTTVNLPEGLTVLPSKMFNDCSSLSSINIPSTITTIKNQVFMRCGSLSSLFVPKSVTTLETQVFYACDFDTLEFEEGSKLISCNENIFTLATFTNLILRNITFNIRIDYEHGLQMTDESLINTFKELWDNTDNKLGDTRTLKLTSDYSTRADNIYVKVIEVTDEMLESDEYISNKIPIEVCDSSDEGAMTLKEYGISKNWVISV